MINGIIAIIAIFVFNTFRPVNYSDNMGGFTVGSAVFCVWELYFAANLAFQVIFDYL